MKVAEFERHIILTYISNLIMLLLKTQRGEVHESRFIQRRYAHVDFDGAE